MTPDPRRGERPPAASRVLVLGNSGPGKTTLAARRSREQGLVHLDLDMLTGWIRGYETRRDEFSLRAHRALFDGFSGEKREPATREAIAAFTPSGV